MVHRFVRILSLALLAAACGAPDQGEETSPRVEACKPTNVGTNSYVVCAFNTDNSDIRLFHSDQNGDPYLQFDTLAREMDEQGLTLVFAMNGGMYHEDRSPVGYYRDGYGDQATINTNDGPGNFHMKPNGVFWLKEGTAGITESSAYLEAGLEPDYATQSGPMLVVDGDLHPGINPDGVSRKRRNGVGVSQDGAEVYFVISDSAVTFYEFASLFLEELETPNALFLDGQVSRLYAPGIDRAESGLDLGPIIGVLEN